MAFTMIDLSILPPEQKSLWPKLREIPRGFVLYGGTAVALQLGHRISEDFDFFTSQRFSPPLLQSRPGWLKDAEIESSGENTLNLSVPVSKVNVHISFFGGLPLKRVNAALEADNGVFVASLPDLLGTKCKAILDRAENKDYQDIAAILGQTDLTLTDGLAAACTIFGKHFIPLSSLKALAYTADLPEALPDSDRAFLQEAVKRVSLDHLPTVKSQGEIGDHAPGTVPH